MMSIVYFGKKLQRLCSSSFLMAVGICRSLWFHFLKARANPFLAQLCYFVSVSFLGFLILKALNPRTQSFSPGNLDLFFTSVSASTVSSMSTVEMEVFSNSQLVLLTVLMFIGGEVFTSTVGLLVWKYQLKNAMKVDGSFRSESEDNRSFRRVVRVTKPDRTENLETGYDNDNNLITSHLEGEFLKYESVRFLGFVVLGYLVINHVLGIGLVTLYVALIPTAKHVLNKKGLNLFTFSVFTTVSTFASCGFVPTNENMVIFKKNSGLLLILIPQVLLGNTLFPSCLRFTIWFLGKFCKRAESKYLLNSTTSEVDFLHLLPSLHSSLLAVTVVGFILVQFVLFCLMDWNSVALNGLSSYEKIVGVLFQCVNSRHTGETIVDLSIISSAILVLFVFMMYLPPYTSFLPVKGEVKRRRSSTSRGEKMENLIFSQLSYLIIFTILVCITERQKMKEDPLNFTVLNVVLEVVSAYGNVGFSVGYSCGRQLKADGDGKCVDKWFGFSGKWSDEGKIVLILVMFFGRLKKFNMDGGKAWILF